MTSYKDTVLWVNRVIHFKNLIRGDMIHLIELEDHQRDFYFRSLARIDRDRFSDAWVNADASTDIQAEAYKRIEDDLANELHDYYNTLLKSRAEKGLPTTFKAAPILQASNSTFEPYGMHFQPYGYRESRSSGPDREQRSYNINNDWIAHSHPSYSVPDVSSSVCDAGSSGGDCS